MKIQYLAPVVAILLIVSVSGCIDQFSGLQSLFGGTKQPTIEQTPDIIITQGMRIIPNPPLSTGDEFTLLFTLKNQDMSQPIEDVNVKLYNWGVCTPDVEQFFPNPDDWTLADNKASYTRTFTDIGPSVEETIEWTFETPTRERIAGIEADCPIKWEVEYNFSAISQDDFYVISKERKREFDTTDTTWQGTDQAQYVGIGPVKIYYEFETPPPVKTNSTIQFSVQVVDKGVGLYSKISNETMFIKVPADWVSGDYDEDVKEACTRKFEPITLASATGTEGVDFKTIGTTIVALENGFVIYRNIEIINVYNRQTSKTICRFTAPDLDSVGIPESSYLFSTNITDYTYRLPDETSVHIKPSV